MYTIMRMLPKRIDHSTNQFLTFMSKGTSVPLTSGVATSSRGSTRRAMTAKRAWRPSCDEKRQETEEGKGRTGITWRIS